MYDVIGDIHGHADELEALLERMGYAEREGVYRHPARTVIFAGDLIDRGPRIARVLEIARRMTESGVGRIVMGNHELNALAYHTPNPDEPGAFLRARNEKHTRQHQATLEQIPDGPERRAMLEWFASIPLWLELPEIRVVHACWVDSIIERLAGVLAGTRLDPRLLREATDRANPLFKMVETTLKGMEIELPDGRVLRDKDGHERRELRIRWYRPSAGETLASYSFAEHEGIPEIPVSSVGVDHPGYPVDERPIFFGHYWLKPRNPEPLAPNVCCLDYSVAKGGFLCGYRWDGERVLKAENFVRSDARA